MSNEKSSEYGSPANDALLSDCINSAVFGASGIPISVNIKNVGLLVSKKIQEDHNR